MDHETDDPSTAAPKGNDESTLARGTAATAAAAPMLDATEPAPSQDETENIHAWSQHGDDDTDVIHRRSWKLPVALAGIAVVAAMTSGFFMLWPTQKHVLPEQVPAAVTPRVVPPAPPAPPVSPDVVFINTLNDSLKNEPDYKPASQGDPSAILTGHDVCTKLSNLYQKDSSSAYGELLHQMTAATGMPDKWADALVLASARAYCPQYLQH